ncbi:MAG: epoxyqueuosine reductase QueH [Spirochaetaceae bacterium]|jgi:predicted adenine nucleotide alpha hydrolase (AANH) superfamily ATPase|nr:epoxyqueuosine reductase QueH [Spirochaetaceae bacterium]
MKTLLHTCCAPCSVKCIETLREEEIEPVLFWYNPNIHPFTEYRSRRDALIEYAKTVSAELILQDEYGLKTFLANTVIVEGHPVGANRCGYCYRCRLEAAASFAAEKGFDSFTTTLLVSPYQNHEFIRKTGEETAERYGVRFLYRDFRPRFREGQQAAREAGLYMQKYCGCIFSEEERYLKKR